METLIKGTKENVIVDVADRVGSLATLTGTTPTFDVYRKDGTSVQTAVAATPVGLSAYCLIDTTLVIYTPDEYNLYLKFSSGVEVPDLGPNPFKVISK